MLSLNSFFLAFCLWVSREWATWQREILAVRLLEIKDGVCVSQETIYDGLPIHHVFPRPTTVCINNARITSDIWNLMKRLRVLQYLKIQECTVDDTLDVSFEHWRFLKDIDIMGTPLKFEAVRSFASLPTLESICLYDVGATDEWMQEVVKVENLHSVVVGGDKITDRGVKALISGTRSLWQLGLPDTAVSDAVALTISRLKYLEVLDLSNTAITDGCIRELCGLSRLRVLNLMDTSVTDNGIAYLAGHRGLQGILLDNTQVTNRTILHLDTMVSLDPDRVSMRGTQVSADECEQWRCNQAERQFRQRESTQRVKGGLVYLKGECDQSRQVWKVSGMIDLQNQSQSMCRLWVSELSIMATMRGVAEYEGGAHKKECDAFYRILECTVGSNAVFYARVFLGPGFVSRDLKPRESLLIPVRFEAALGWEPRAKVEIVELELRCHCRDDAPATCCDRVILLRVPVEVLWIRENQEWLMYPRNVSTGLRQPRYEISVARQL